MYRQEDRSSLSPSSQSRAKASPQEGQAAGLSQAPQLPSYRRQADRPRGLGPSSPTQPPLVEKKVSRHSRPILLQKLEPSDTTGETLK